MKKIFLTILLSYGLFSCDNYLSEEDSPNFPQTSSITPNQQLAGAITQLQRTISINLNDHGSKLTYAWAQDVNTFTGVPDEFSYNYTNSTASDIWESLYLNINNLQTIINYNDPSNLYDNHKAVASILKAQGMSYIISLYGDAPYTQAFKGLLNTTPSYDDDLQIFKSLIILLEDAKSKLNTPNPNAVALGSEDVIFAGNLIKWRDYANTLELKLLLKLSNSTNPTVLTIKSNLQSLLPLGTTYINQDVLVNPGYTNATASQFSPIYQLLGRDITGTFLNSYNSRSAGDYIANVLMGLESNPNINSLGVNDPRRNRNFTAYAAGGLIKGIKQGDVKGSPTCPATGGFSYVGSFVNGDLPPTPTPSGAAGRRARVANGSARGSVMMLNAESKFLQSEALERGLIPGGTAAAKLAFEAGITASFNYYSTLWGNVSAVTYPSIVPQAATYITATSTKLGLGWVGTPNKIEAIMTQKWLALNSISGIEPYFDHVRTTFPVLPLPLGVPLTSVRPQRLIYPRTEYSSNTANVPLVSRGECFSINSKSPFYLQ
jgi:Starch-binding associating with outer membrane